MIHQKRSEQHLKSVNTTGEFHILEQSLLLKAKKKQRKLFQ